MLAHQPDEGLKPASCSTCSCKLQPISSNKHPWRIVQVFWHTHLCQDMAPHLDVCCVLNITLVGLQRLVLFASRLVFVLQGEGGGLLLPSIALLVLPQPWISATSCWEVQFVIWAISAFLHGSFCEDRGAAKSLHGSCCSGRWFSPWLSVAFYFLVRSISTLNSPVLQDNCSNESSLLKGKSWCEDNADIRGLISRFL